MRLDPVLDGIREAIRRTGEDPDREGLTKTPQRWMKALAEMTEGYALDPETILSVTFAPEPGLEYDEIVTLAGIRFSSLCEHHLLPFTGVARVGYIPDGRVVGLSKLARLVECFARRLQIQERMTVQITTAVDEHLGGKGAACVLEAEHSCMACRGIRKEGATMITSSMTGAFRTNPEARAEFLSL